MKRLGKVGFGSIFGLLAIISVAVVGVSSSQNLIAVAVLEDTNEAVVTFDVELDQFGIAELPGDIAPGTDVEVIVNVNGNRDKGPVVGILDSTPVDIFEVHPVGTVSRRGFVDRKINLDEFSDPEVTNNGKIVFGFEMPEDVYMVQFNFIALCRGGSVIRVNRDRNPTWSYDINQRQNVQIKVFALN